MQAVIRNVREIRLDTETLPPPVKPAPTEKPDVKPAPAPVKVPMPKKVPDRSPSPATEPDRKLPLPALPEQEPMKYPVHPYCPIG